MTEAPSTTTEVSRATIPAPRSGSNVLDDALARVRTLDPALALTLAREVNALRESRKFGLVFEKHLPESVKLPRHPVKRGVKVALHNPAKGEEGFAWRVSKVVGAGAGRVAHLAGATEPVPVADLVVVRDFGEPIYPGLTSVGRIDRGEPTSPNHVVIKGENHHVLQALRMTHRRAIDLIYIDPPYNTGNQTWIYNDKYVADQDAFKHSKWLSFIERRLTIARDLMKDTGVIFVAIGDEEHHRLRMLMDQIFGPHNFISDIVWQGGRKNDSRYVSNGADYMLVYARNESALSAAEVRWREEKPGVHEVLSQAATVWSEVDGDENKATAAMRAWFKGQPKDSPVKALARNVYFLPDGTLCRDDNLTSPNPRPNLQYDLLHPETGQPCRMPENGWRYSRETMNKLIAEGKIIFRESHTDFVSVKRPLEDTAGNVVLSVFDRQRTHSGRHLEEVLGDKRFPFPKDHEVLMRWIGLAAPKDATVLDFFGGSGTTTEAVMRLNAQDDGNRQCILVTNNEVSAREAKVLRKAGHTPGDAEWEAKGVFRYVTMPRISTVVTGTRPDGSTYSEGLPANVEFLELTYLDPDRVSRAREFEAIAPLLWMQAGAVGNRLSKEPTEGWALADGYAVLTDIDASESFVKALAALDTPPPIVYVVTDSPSEFEAVAGRIPKVCFPHQLYESYMRNFEINVEVAQ